MSHTIIIKMDRKKKNIYTEVSFNHANYISNVLSGIVRATYINYGA